MDNKIPFDSLLRIWKDMQTITRKQIKKELLDAFKENWETRDQDPYDYEQMLGELSNSQLEQEYERVFYNKMKIKG